MHKIRRFGFEGVIGDDAALPRLRSQYEAMTIQEMRERGYAPVLGMGPYWSTEYDEDKNCYRFKSSVYGLHVGRDVCQQLEGITVEGKRVPLSTALSK